MWFETHALPDSLVGKRGFLGQQERESGSQYLGVGSRVLGRDAASQRQLLFGERWLIARSDLGQGKASFQALFAARKGDGQPITYMFALLAQYPLRSSEWEY